MLHDHLHMCIRIYIYIYMYTHICIYYIFVHLSPDSSESNRFVPTASNSSMKIIAPLFAEPGLHFSLATAASLTNVLQQRHVTVSYHVLLGVLGGPYATIMNNLHLSSALQTHQHIGNKMQHCFQSNILSWHTRRLYVCTHKGKLT